MYIIVKVVYDYPDQMVWAGEKTTTSCSSSFRKDIYERIVDA